jgi:putative nucleotidyltransferase with HDIG domain
MAATIAVEELRIGMFIQLDGGWLSHPFPVSNFRLSTPEQLATVRGLGLREVRWVPEKSDLGPPPSALGSGSSSDAAAQEVGLPAASPPALTEAQLAAQDRHMRLLQQREAALECEQQHGEATRALRGVFDAVHKNPAAAGAQSAALTQTMLNKMLAAQDVGIRLVKTGNDAEAAHGMNVSVVSLLIGRTLGLAEDELLDLGVGALLHDVGKCQVAPRFRHLQEGFSAPELQAYRDHVVHGVRLAQGMGLTPGATSVVAQHHELADGSGFPQRLGNDRIGMAARIVAIVNRYDNLCNPRSRQPALTPHEAVSILFAQSRNRFDGAVLNTFIRMMGVYPAGSLVQLTDDRFAMVMGANSSRPLKPRVLVHDPKVPRSDALLLDLEMEPDLGIRRSVPAPKVPAAALSYLDPRPNVSYYFEPLTRHGDHEELAA